MKTLTLLLVSAGVALAQYGNGPSYPAQDAPPATGGYGSPAPAPVAYPPIWPSWGHHHHHRSSSSDSRRHSRRRSKSDSDEHKKKKKCGSCRRIRLLTGPLLETFPVVSTPINYFKDSHGCKHAIITCPLLANGDVTAIALSTSNTAEPDTAAAAGLNTQAVASCNRRGNWEIPAIVDVTQNPLVTKVQEFQSLACADLMDNMDALVNVLNPTQEE